MHRRILLSLFIAVVLTMLLALPHDRSIAEELPRAFVEADRRFLRAYMIELEMPPAAIYSIQLQQDRVSAAAAVAATQAHIAAIDHMQRALLQAVEASGAQTLYRLQRVYNGMAVLAAPERVALFEGLPGVKAVHPIVSKQPALTSSVPFLGAPALWRGFAGLLPARGEGVRIAIIDTGIDYLHVDFGGPGTGYAQNNPTVIGDVPGFPGVKVVGGYDFAGDAYNADPRSSSYNPIPVPDTDPMDCYGHGTHVAGIAAGFGVTRSSQTYAGPWDDSTQFANLRIGPGVAPLAQLYALKVFGCTGSSDIVDLAIEWAVDPDGNGDFSDRVDVINLSLGSPLGALYDTTTVAADNAAALGVIVVASAGNSGDVRFALGSPSNGDHVLSVAATQHGLVEVGHGPPQPFDRVTGFSSRGPRTGDAALKPDIAAPGAGIVSAASQSGAGALSLSGTSMAAPHVAGAMALLRQIHPDWSSAELKALAMNTALPLVRSGAALTSTLNAPSLVGAGRIDLTAAAHAPAIAYAADAPGRVSLSFGMPEVLDSYQASQRLRVANKSNLPVTYQLSYVPLTDMPGVTVTVPISTVTAPVAGFADAVVTLLADVTHMARAASAPDSTRPRFDEESGYLLLWPAEATWRAALPHAVHPAEVAATYRPAERMLELTVTFTASVPDGSGALYLRTVDGSVLGYTAPLSLTTAFTGTLSLAPLHELLLATNKLSIELWLDDSAEVLEGTLSTEASILHVPVHAAPRPVSAMRSASSLLAFSEPLTATLFLTGQALYAGAPLTAVASQVSVFQLEVQSPNSRPERLPDHALDLYDSADISHVGVATDFPTATNDEALIFFGIAAHAPWSTPNQVRFDVLIDVDGDGTADFRLFNSSIEGYTSERFFGDSFVSALENLRTRQRTIQKPLNGAPPSAADLRPFASRVMVLPVRVADLALPPGQTVISYTVESYHRSFGDQPEDIIDRTPSRRFDLARPALHVMKEERQVPFLDDRPGAALTPTLDLYSYAVHPGTGILLFHHHNGVEGQVEVVEVNYSWPATLHLPLLMR
ncbi:S8 family serine peptidase [Caldilinea sp.]|uniref:S8 family peptidase n=1 Tax=Caldilinea sp. TaxID=2293560 RepID=UPI001B150F8A|nr:S8 family serine peptidase [Caldilinea sp.]MBO9392255.1 S8 family serine peptidase [Caldilinea sp.]